VLRYDRTELPRLLEQIDRTGYGLTLGVHTRIDETVLQVVEAAHVGNVYVNRNVVGAVVGVQPFGGEGLSGTGPKAGGPLYLLRLLSACPPDAARRAVEQAGAGTVPQTEGAEGDGPPPLSHARAADPALPLQGLANSAVSTAALSVLREAARAAQRSDRVALCDRLAARSPVGAWRRLPGPTGEANLYAMRPRETVLCLADDEADRWAQLAAVLAVGGRVLWPAEAQALVERLPAAVADRVTLVDDWTRHTVRFDAVLHHGERADRLRVCRAVAGRSGAVVVVVGLRCGDGDVPLERLVVERSLSINTAAAGGNASLMALE